MTRIEPIDESEIRARQTGNARAAREARIASADRKLQREAADSPGEKRDAVISFARVRPMKDALNDHAARGFAIEHMYHAEVIGDQVFIGGFPVNGPLDEAMASYSEAHHAMLKHSVQNLVQQEPPDDPKIRASAERLADATRIRLDRFETDGLQLSGLRVNGTLENLKDVASDDEVLAVELIEQKEQLAPIAPGPETSK